MIMDMENKVTYIKNAKDAFAICAPIAILLAVIGNIIFFTWHAKDVVASVAVNQVAIAGMIKKFESHEDLSGHPIIVERAKGYEKKQDTLSSDITAIKKDVHIVSTEIKVLRQYVRDIADNNRK